MSFREVSEHFQPILGVPSVKCYKCGETIPLRLAKKAYHSPIRDNNDILHNEYICNECRRKLMKAKEENE